MPPKQKTKNQSKQSHFLQKIITLTPLLVDLEAGSISDATFAAIQEINQELHHSYTIDNVGQLLPLLGALEAPEHLSLFRNYQHIKRQESAKKKGDKKQFVKSLHLKSPALPAADMDLPKELRNRDRIPSIKSRTVIIDRGNERFVFPRDRAKMQVVGDSAHWRRVSPNESVIFQNSKGEIELAVIRNVSGNPELLHSMNKIIQAAACFRRNVRPNHPGTMVQLGYNAGPRHCRVFGLVNNFKSAKLALETKAKQDEQAIGALSFFWHLIQSHAPKEVVDSVNSAIEQSGMPEIGSRFGEDHSGYAVTIGTQEFTFPRVRKAPCEGYFATNYTAPAHSDKCFANFAFAWSTKHSTSCRLRSRQSAGGNFADISLRVLVEAAPDTLLVFKPQYRHGTTVARPTTLRTGMVITFSMHIKLAYDIAVANSKKGKRAKFVPVKRNAGNRYK